MNDENSGGLVPQGFSPKTISQAAGDIVNKATADLPDDQRSAIRWLHNHACDLGLTQEATGKLIGYSGAAISQLFSGKYSPVEPIVAAINSFQKLWIDRQQGKGIPFIETSMSRKIFNVCHAARNFQRIGLIYGDTQIGKTVALMEYARLFNHGSTIYVQVPTGGSLGNFLVALGRRLRLSPSLNDRDLKRRIIEAFDDRMVLIVDEAHRAISPSVTRGGILTLEYIRELFDATQCGLVLCATNVFRRALEEEGPAQELLKQTHRRRFCQLQLPDRPGRRDLDAFSAAFGLEPSTGDARKLEDRIIADDALGMWLMLLRMAREMAVKRKQTLEWKHVLQAHIGRLKMENGTED